MWGMAFSVSSHSGWFPAGCPCPLSRIPQSTPLPCYLFHFPDPFIALRQVQCHCGPDLDSVCRVVARGGPLTPVVTVCGWCSQAPRH